jgi:uncharacterized protein (TIGR03435 family)
MMERTNAAQGVVYLLDDDNPGWAHATTELMAKGSEVSFRIANIEASFKGTRTADAIAGVWTQHGLSQPLRLVQAAADAAWAIPAQATAMDKATDPSFEVVTVKPADPDSHRAGFHSTGRRVEAENQTLADVFCVAYGVHPKQIVGAPGWFSHERWVISGVADMPGPPNLKQIRGIFRKVLEDRFNLKVHKETQDLPVYLLEVGKGEQKMTRSMGDPDGLSDSSGNMNAGINDMRYTNITMDGFAEQLGGGTDRPILNQTGLAGRWDFRLKWTSSLAQTDDPNASPVLFTALQEQLGLKVETTRAPAQVYVVEHVEHPSPN